MDVFTMVAIIVVVSVAGGVYSNYLKSKRSDGDMSEREAMEAELGELRGRIEVLEKIVTDEKYHLSRELDALEQGSR